jgi:hypothetical protein
MPFLKPVSGSRLETVGSLTLAMTPATHRHALVAQLDADAAAFGQRIGIERGAAARVIR